MTARPPVLEIDVARVDDAYVVGIQGELDIAGCPAVELALETAERSPSARILLDLEEMTFIDGRGLRALLDATHRSAANGNRLQITRGKGHLPRVLRLTGLDTMLPLTDARLCPTIRQARPFVPTGGLPRPR